MKPADATISRWWRDLNNHRQVEGRCPVCGTPRRCWPWAEAYAGLLTYDLLGPPPPPRTDVRPDETAGPALPGREGDSRDTKVPPPSSEAGRGLSSYGV
ncbi:hypothetical protein [Salinispora mooreana]|uniref:hypothetical protein n=1 Tax=Salinispora mooreana TaxID=999545 RepID=UPI0003A60D75|nr:hypothetical protein [Salinispora mooreana]